MGKFSSEEIESQYNLIKMLLAEPENYRDGINAIKKDIVYMPMELRRTWGRKYYLMNKSQIAFIMIFNFWKLVNSHSRKLTEGV